MVISLGVSALFFYDMILSYIPGLHSNAGIIGAGKEHLELTEFRFFGHPKVVFHTSVLPSLLGGSILRCDLS